MSLILFLYHNAVYEGSSNTQESLVIRESTSKIMN